ncbi:MAG TPA: xanthine dehydrogenase family protein subunit M [Gaiellaceae bacterium]|nr:xanthine dehydrogenase family protein subunit M [Gaiellaceae bacterium]
MYPSRPAPFAYHRAASVAEAVRLLAELGDARPLAGGHSLLPAMKLRLSTPAALVDIGRIPGLDAIEADGDALRIGALARHADVAASEDVRRAARALAEAASLIGDRQVRNRGTIGGSLAHADPGADYPTVVRALGATIAAAGSGGEREIAADELFRGLFTTALEPGELVTAVRVPAARPGDGSAYVKHPHPASGYAVAAAAACVSLEGGACTRARLVVGGVAGAPVDATAAAASLVGAPPSANAVAEAAAGVPELLDGAIGDAYASAGYRRHLASVLARRALALAFERAAA